MPESTKNPEGSKEPFVAKEDRPEVKITMDTPLSELRVRELSEIIGRTIGSGKNPNFEVGKTPIKDFFDAPDFEVAKDHVKDAKGEKLEKNELKELKGDKFEKFENLKREKNEKREKPEKSEIKEVKAEKVEADHVFDPGRVPPGPDPRFEQLIEAVAGLTKQVSQLSNQVEEMKKKG
jgi:hypothetical protein